MKRFVSGFFLLLLAVSVASSVPLAQAQGSPHVVVRSVYQIQRYGYAYVNETFIFSSNSTTGADVPSVTIGFGNLSSKVANYSLIGDGFSLAAQSPNGPFTVIGGGTIAPSGSKNFTLTVLMTGMVWKAANGSLVVELLARPSISITVDKIVEVVKMPPSTVLTSRPKGLKDLSAGSNVTYSNTIASLSPGIANTSIRAVITSTAEDLHPLAVYSASRTVSAAPDGTPLITDSISFENLGANQLNILVVKPLAPSGVLVTLLPPIEPRLLGPVRFALTNYIIPLSASVVASPVPPGSNYTVTYRYAPDSKYYTTSGGQVVLNLPNTPPIDAFVSGYKIAVTVPNGVRVVTAPPGAFTNVAPRREGSVSVAYAPTVGWGVESAIPGASVVFVLLLVGLIVTRSTVTEEEETEEESSTERASAMVQAFDEKTTLINGMWAEISGQDPNEFDKEYFAEVRGRLDAFRSRALQRLNEVKQKSTTQKFFDLLNQIHATEREVDRATKDKLNLYEQYYMRRMRKEVYDRLLPQYTKRLERALNQLSDELHVVQKEAKLL
ncbi:MAG: hypothetical protein HY247_07430 [archaeon]|nr:MAG: hypothetical protein HY247_07430 [archaeon]